MAILPYEYTTLLEYGTLLTISSNGALLAVFVTLTAEVIITIPPITVEGLRLSNANTMCSRETPSPFTRPLMSHL